jgi:hypothetical protein
MIITIRTEQTHLSNSNEVSMNLFFKVVVPLIFIMTLKDLFYLQTTVEFFKKNYGIIPCDICILNMSIKE